MATRRPLAVVSGAVSEVPSGDTIDPAALPPFVAEVASTDSGYSVTVTDEGDGVVGLKISDSIVGDLQSLVGTKQDADADLTDISGLTYTDGDFLRRVSGHFANITTAALKTALALAKADVGLGNVDNVADASKPVSTLQQAALDAKADLVTGKVPSSQLPSYVDDVVEAANFAALPGTGETSKIYVTLDTNNTYRWTGSAYVEIAASPGTTDDVTEGSTNKYYHAATAKADTVGDTIADAVTDKAPSQNAVFDALATKQGLDATLTALAGLATGANKLAYSTGTDTFSQTDLTAAGRALIDDADATAQIVTLGLAALYQPLDSDLTALAGIAPANDDIVQRKAGAWTNRTIAQLLTDLGLAALYQPLDSDLTTLAGLTPTSGNVVTGNGSAWTSAAPASPAFSTKVETIADSSSLTGNSASGATQVGVTTALTSDAAVNAPSNGTVGAPYRYIITASGGSRTVTPTGFAASTDNGSGAAIVVASGKTVSIFAQYIGSSGWLYGGYELLA